MIESCGCLNIGIFSIITRLSPKALRLYEEKGLLIPVKKEITGYRMYAYSQIRKGMLLRRMAQLGFGIQDMKVSVEVLDGGGDTAALDIIIARRIREVSSQMRQLETIRGELENRSFEEVTDMKNGTPCMKELPAQRVVSRREKGSYGEAIPRLIGEICNMIGPQEPQAYMVGPPMAIYHDNEYKETCADVEVAIPVSGRVTIDASRFEIKTLPAGKAISAIHCGAYHKVGETWGKVFQYIQENGLRPNAAGRELYLNNPAVVSEDELITEVQVPVE
jgi:effector-binding domain-containing protein